MTGCLINWTAFFYFLPLDLLQSEWSVTVGKKSFRISKNNEAERN